MRPAQESRQASPGKPGKLRPRAFTTKPGTLPGAAARQAVRTEGRARLSNLLAWGPGCMPWDEAWDLSEPGLPEAVS